ncbi:hypothetical protein [Saccharopolyspora gregorii]|uniref:Uncharacterized protein n=1 Tax=Saccharopolyspora gregorii TaxID=33914 RepID=A0ABP6S319_9PSEU
MNAWRGEGKFTLPTADAHWGEHFFGNIDELVQAGRGALTDSGVKVPRDVDSALSIAITVAQLRSRLPDQLDGIFTVPMPDLNGRWSSTLACRRPRSSRAPAAR